MTKEYFCIRTEKGYFAGWKRRSYIDANGRKRFAGREPEFSDTIQLAFDSTQTIGDTVETVKKNLTTRGNTPEIIPVFWANGRWQASKTENNADDTNAERHESDDELGRLYYSDVLDNYGRRLA